MRQEAFGHIGLRPDEFYLMRIDDFKMLRIGFIDRTRYEESLLRKQTALIAESMTGKGNGIKFVMNNWKIGNEVTKEERTFDKQKALLKKFKERQALKNLKEKNG